METNSIQQVVLSVNKIVMSELWFDFEVQLYSKQNLR